MVEIDPLRRGNDYLHGSLCTSPVMGRLQQNGPGAEEGLGGWPRAAEEGVFRSEAVRAPEKEANDMKSLQECSPGPFELPGQQHRWSSVLDL